MTIATLRGAKKTARAVLRSVPSRFWEQVFPKDVLALGYHMVSDEDLPHLKLYPYKNSRQFENDVAFAQGRTVDYGDVASHRLRGTVLPPNRMLFTFDDGFAECFNVARPILKKYGVNALFFVTTDFIDDRTPFHETKLSLCFTEIERSSSERVGAVLETLAREPLEGIGPNNERANELLAGARVSRLLGEQHRELLRMLLSLWHDHEPELDRLCGLLGVDAGEYARRRPVFMSSEQLKTLASEGFTVGGHALSHHLLQMMSREQMEHEIVTSCRIVRDITGQEFVPFAFPYGGQDVDRQFLAGILARNPFIQMIFDSGPLGRGAPFVVDRVWAEDPFGDPSVSNLPLALRHAWSSPSAWFRSSSDPSYARTSVAH
jgi:peptidoglycan/xylan/chitin deacetylase (PgdA/CDA1 family)